MPKPAITKKGIYWIVVFAIVEVVLLINIGEFLPAAHKGSIKWILLFIAMTAALLLTLYRILIIFSKGKEYREKRCIGLPLFLFCLVFFPCLWHFTVEIIDNRAFRKIDLAHNLASILICAVVFVFLFFVSRSLSITLWAGSIFYFVFGCVQYYAITFRELPVMFNDLVDTGAAMTVVGGYSLKPTAYILTCFVAFFLSCVNILARGDRTPPGKTLLANVLERVAAVALIVGVGIGIANSANFSKFVGSINNRIKAYREVGSQLCFIQSIKNSHITPPASYDYRNIEQLAETYVEKAKEYNASLKTGVKPNVIAIMNESFSDIDLTGKDHLAERVMPFFNSLQENEGKGLTMVSTYGGGTCKSEFEYLTGDSMHAFDSSVSPYALFGKRMTSALPAQLKEQGYRTVAVHPYQRKNYSRPETYAAMGFDEYLSEEDFTDPQYIRKYISDHSDFQKLTELIEETEEPLFVFNVTMQNHGGYSNSDYTADEVAGDGSYAPANQFVSLIKDTDEAFEELIHYLEKCEEPTLLIMFGDHLPSLASQFYKEYNGFTKGERKADTGLRYYQTPYIIWANYDVEEALKGEAASVADEQSEKTAEAVELKDETAAVNTTEQDEKAAAADAISDETSTTISLNYLGLKTLELIGAKLTPFQLYLKDLEEKVPAFNAFGWCGTDGALHEEGSDTETAALIEENDCIVYNELIDRGHRVDAFYELPEESE